MKRMSGEKPDLNSDFPSAAAETEKTRPNFPVVGIGASAGGLAAFEAFFSAMPPKSEIGMAFVLVQHLAPDHKSILTELVRRYTRMQVFEVVDGIHVEPNCAYIIPPNRDMAFVHGNLQLLEQEPSHGARISIDFFFRSLARDLHERAICIVLSGTGSDGSLGVRAVKGEGGMAMAQNPETAEYGAMPSNAISTGLVDYILPASDMPARLIAYAKKSFGKMARKTSIPPLKIEAGLNAICSLLRTRTGHDFSLYKQNTLIRRIERRMAVQLIPQMEEYTLFLQQNPEELDSLYQDLMIGVTNFFRDAASFDNLQKHVIPRLFEGKNDGDSIRIWVPGCSTGEEPYSLAILIQERMEILMRNFKIQLFATDINSRAIALARTGTYPASISVDITPERLAKYFNYDEEAGTYRIIKSIREMLIFSEQDIILDPPYSRLDMISCRNLLIYLGSDLQKRLIPMFHFALVPGGYLFLGGSESIGEFRDLFSVTDHDSKIFQGKSEATGSRRLVLRKFLPPLIESEATRKRSGTSYREIKEGLRETAERAMLRECIPVGVLVNARGDILYLHGRTGMYLEPAPGEVVTNILKMAREGLQRDLMTALHHAASTRASVSRKGLKVRTNGHFSTVNLKVSPVNLRGDGLKSEENRPDEEDLYMVILEEAPEVLQNSSGGIPGPGCTEEKDSRVSEAESVIDGLRKELEAKEEYLRSAVEELETSNEELQSVNEELQSTNEELETSKEEMQSVNEELITVNNELQSKLSDLTRLNNDISNLLAGTGIGTIFVDRQLRIISYTPAVIRIINLIPSDLGRPVAHTVSNLVGYDSLVADALAVQVTEVPIEHDVQTITGTWYTMRIIPYRTRENVVEGVAINFVDITERKLAQEKILEINLELENRVQQGIEESRAKDQILINQSRQAAMGEMISNIAHQWRQPLNALGLMIQNTTDAYRDNRLVNDYMGKFEKKSMDLIQYMSQTIDDFRNYFKPTKEMIAFSIEKTIRKTYELVENGLKEEGIVLTIQAENDWEIFGYPNEFGQVLLNLIQNAKDAFLERKIKDRRINISLIAKEKGICVKVSDNAGGIPAQVLEKVFDPYFSTKESGTGIGLYMSRMLIENQMNGKLSVCNTAEGAEFCIYLMKAAPV